MDELKTVNCEQLMTTPLKPIEFCVDGMISSGLFILAGAPKVGKSWLALDIALSIAKGEKVLGRETKSGSALYLCLEDSYTRIQNRLFELTSEPSESLHFAIMAGTLGGVLEKQIETVKSQHTDLKIIIIDTLQKVRSGDDASYASDYKELSVLKNLADSLQIAILLIHHTRKCCDNDPFNMISGTTGISGCVGRISDEQFRTLSAYYMDEQKALETKIQELDAEIEQLKENSTNVQKFFDVAKKYTDIEELTPDVLRTRYP